VRTHGDVERPEEAAGRDHVCWFYEDGESFAAAARAYLQAGLERGDRLMWIGDDFGGRVGLPDAEALVARGALEVLPASSSYEAGQSFARCEQHTFYDDAVRRARADGYAGLCVVAEVTAMAADPVRSPELLRWEHLADRFIAGGSGMTAMCLYRDSDLPEETVKGLASIHPWARETADELPFRTWFDGARLCVAGCVDTFCAPRLAEVLAATPPDGSVVVLDLTGLEFADAAGVRVIARWSQELRGREVTVHLVGAPRFFRKMWHLLGYDQGAGAVLEPTG
jgi:anti-anti-sigma regulatory factor